MLDFLWALFSVFLFLDGRSLMDGGFHPPFGRSVGHKVMDGWFMCYLLIRSVWVKFGTNWKWFGRKRSQNGEVAEMSVGLKFQCSRSTQTGLGRPRTLSSESGRNLQKITETHFFAGCSVAGRPRGVSVDRGHCIFSPRWISATSPFWLLFRPNHFQSLSNFTQTFLNTR